MLKEKVKSKLLILVDIILVNISIILSYSLTFNGYSNIPANFLENVKHICIVATIIKILSFYVMKLYSSLWRYAGIYELNSIVGAVFVSNATVLSYLFVSKIAVPRRIFIIAFLIDVFLIGGVRFAYRTLRKVIKDKFSFFGDAKRILVVGAGDAGAVIVKELKHHLKLQSKPVAIIDEKGTKIGRKINGVPIVGTISDIPRIIEERKIDEVIIALENSSKKVLNEIYEDCSEFDCKVKILPSFTQLIDESVVMQKIRDVDIEDLLGRDPVKMDIEEISLYLENETVLVTGGGGSIGSELCRQIASFSPQKLIILDNYENNAYEIQNELMFRYPELDLFTIIANIREKHRLESIFKEYAPTVVFHTAAHKHVPLMESNPTEAMRNNIFGTLNVVECADKFGIKRFVLISTDKAVNPTNVMGATKRIAEMIIQAVSKCSKTEFVAVRFGNVLGSSGSVIPLFKKQIEQGGPVTVTHPEITRFFMTIPEAVQLVIQAGAMAKGGEIFVLDMGEPVKIYELARNLIRLSGFDPDEDIKINITGLRPGEKLYEELLLAEEGLKSTKNNKIYVAQPVFTDFEMLKKELDYLNELMTSDAEKAVDYLSLIVPNYRRFGKNIEKDSDVGINDS